MNFLKNLFKNKKTTVIILVGEPGSGKSTYAHDLWKLRSRTQRVAVLGKDKLRELITGYTEESIHEYYTQPDILESEITISMIESELLKNLSKVSSVIVLDNPHVSLESISKITKKFRDVELHILMTDLETSISRAGSRLRSVDAHTVTKFYREKEKLIKELNYRTELKNNLIIKYLI